MMSDFRIEWGMTRSRGVNGKEYEHAIDHGFTHDPPEKTTNRSGHDYHERRLDDNHFIADAR